ncbi:Oidioi.mRNA.OKI2018_I69.PAR.g11947.t1.cds [Oikopleura dioica]|uniref:Oidioi.mRNA.OKI2018_I69.PAR.g11947.t1.cds n=1 Tax=Oikopleura dioica TaxID=34765 RepID=A0ABN7S2U0_OIKDI|nr:Oidioi.mRNA.OKI2018_I69.PAR.g11947.t1.cds [Oikopleura dioica]
MNSFSFGDGPPSPSRRNDKKRNREEDGPSGDTPRPRGTSDFNRRRSNGNGRYFNPRNRQSFGQRKQNKGNNGGNNSGPSGQANKPPRKLFQGLNVLTTEIGDTQQMIDHRCDLARQSAVHLADLDLNAHSDIVMNYDLFDEKRGFLKKEDGFDYLQSSASELTDCGYTSNNHVVHRNAPFVSANHYEDILSTALPVYNNLVLSFSWVPEDWKGDKYQFHLFTRVTVQIMEETLTKLHISWDEIRSLIVVNNNGEIIQPTSDNLTRNNRATVKGIRFRSLFPTLKFIILANGALSPVDPFHHAYQIPRWAMLFTFTERLSGGRGFTVVPNNGVKILSVLRAVLERWFHYVLNYPGSFTFHQKSNVLNVLPIAAIFNTTISSMNVETLSPNAAEFDEWISRLDPLIFDKRFHTMSRTIPRFYHDISRAIIVLQEYFKAGTRSHWFSMTSVELFISKLELQRSSANLADTKLTVKMLQDPDVMTSKAELAKRTNHLANDLSRSKDDGRITSSVDHIVRNTTMGKTVAEAESQLIKAHEERCRAASAIQNVALYTHSTNRIQNHQIIEIRKELVASATTPEERERRQRALDKDLAFNLHHDRHFNTDGTLFGSLTILKDKNSAPAVVSLKDDSKVSLTGYMSDTPNDQLARLHEAAFHKKELSTSHYYYKAGLPEGSRSLQVNTNPFTAVQNEVPSEISFQNASPLDNSITEAEMPSNENIRQDDDRSSTYSSDLQAEELTQRLNESKVKTTKHFLFQKTLLDHNIAIEQFSDDERSEVSAIIQSVQPPAPENQAEISAPTIVQVKTIDPQKGQVDHELTDQFATGTDAKWNAISKIEEQNSWINTVETFDNSEDFILKKKPVVFSSVEMFNNVKDKASVRTLKIENAISRFTGISNKKELGVLVRTWHSNIYELRGILVNNLRDTINTDDKRKIESMELDDAASLENWNNFLAGVRVYRLAMYDPESLISMLFCNADTLMSYVPIPPSKIIYNWVKLMIMDNKKDNGPKTPQNILLSQLVALGLLVTSRKSHVAVYKRDDLPGQHLLTSKPIYARILKVSPALVSRRFNMQELNFTIFDCPKLAEEKPGFKAFLNEVTSKLLANTLLCGFLCWLRDRNFISSCSYRGLLTLNDSEDDDDDDSSSGLPPLLHPPLLPNFKQYKNLLEIETTTQREKKVLQFFESGTVPRMPFSHNIPSPEVLAKGKGLAGILPPTSELPALKKSIRCPVPTSGDLSAAVIQHNEQIINAADNIVIISANLGNCRSLDKIKRLVNHHRSAHIFCISELFMEKDVALDKSNWPNGFHIHVGMPSRDGKNQIFTMIILRNNITVKRMIPDLHQNLALHIDVNGTQLLACCIYNFCGGRYDNYKTKYNVDDSAFLLDLAKVSQEKGDSPCFITGDFNLELAKNSPKFARKCDAVKNALRELRNGHTLESAIDHFFLFSGKLDLTKALSKPGDHRTSLQSDGHVGLVTVLPIRPPNVPERPLELTLSSSSLLCNETNCRCDHGAPRESCITEAGAFTLYADDVAAAVFGADINDVNAGIASTAEGAADRIESLGLRVADQKTEVLLISKSDHLPNINIRGQAIPVSNSLKYLGVTLASVNGKLSLNNHDKIITCRLRSNHHKLATLRGVVSPKANAQMARGLNYGIINHTADYRPIPPQSTVNTWQRIHCNSLLGRTPRPWYIIEMQRKMEEEQLSSSSASQKPTLNLPIDFIRLEYGKPVADDDLIVLDRYGQPTVLDNMVTMGVNNMHKVWKLHLPVCAWESLKLSLILVDRKGNRVGVLPDFEVNFLGQRLQMVMDDVDPGYAVEYVLYDIKTGSYKAITHIEIQSPSFIAGRNVHMAITTAIANTSAMIRTTFSYGLASNSSYQALPLGRKFVLLDRHGKTSRLLGIQPGSWMFAAHSPSLRSMRPILLPSRATCYSNRQSHIWTLELKAASIALYGDFFILPTAGAAVILKDKKGTAGAWINIRTVELLQRSNDAMNALPSVLMKLSHYYTVLRAFRQTGLFSNLDSNEQIASIAVNLCSQPCKSEIAVLKTDIVSLIHKFGCGDEHTDIFDYAHGKSLPHSAFLGINKGILEQDLIEITQFEWNMMEEVASSSFGHSLSTLLNKMAAHVSSSMCNFCSTLKDVVDSRDAGASNADLENRAANAQKILIAFINKLKAISTNRKSGESRRMTESLYSFIPAGEESRMIRHLLEHHACLIQATGFLKTRPTRPALHVLWRSRALTILVVNDCCKLLKLLVAEMARITGPGNPSVVDPELKDHCTLAMTLLSIVAKTKSKLETNGGNAFSKALAKVELAINTTLLKASPSFTISREKARAITRPAKNLCPVQSIEKADQAELDRFPSLIDPELSIIKAMAEAQLQLLTNIFQGSITTSGSDVIDRGCPLLSMTTLNDSSSLPSGEEANLALVESIHSLRLRALVDSRKRRGDFLGRPTRYGLSDRIMASTPAGAVGEEILHPNHTYETVYAATAVVEPAIIRLDDDEEPSSSGMKLRSAK